MGFFGESAPPAKLLAGPNGGWHAVTGRILGVSMAELEKGILIFSMLSSVMPSSTSVWGMPKNPGFGVRSSGGSTLPIHLKFLLA